MDEKKSLAIMISAMSCLPPLMPVAACAERASPRVGICFRVDDNHPPLTWRDYAQVFDKYGFTFCAALNPATMSRELIELARELQNNGHEIMDHTPNHSCMRFAPPPGTTPRDYHGRPGVHHVDGRFVYLNYGLRHPERMQLHRGSVKDTILRSDQQDVFADTNKMRFKAVYFPHLDQAYEYQPVAEDGRTALRLISFWKEADITVPDRESIEFIKLGRKDLTVPPDAAILLARASLDWFAALGLERPYSWIQPGGGGGAIFWRADAKAAFGDACGYLAGATYPDRALKALDEYDPDGDKRFGMMWGDFSLERWDQGKTVADVRTRIADGLANRRMLLNHSHFKPWRDADQWQAYLGRVDALLAWCRDKNIPVRTYAQWAEILYGAAQPPAGNVFPCMETDLDENGRPDGYEVDTQHICREVVPPDASLSLRRIGPGTLFAINGLGGAPRGRNELTLWTRGVVGAALRLVFTFPENREKIVSVDVPADGAQWTRRRVVVEAPDTVSRSNITASVVNAPAHATVYIASPRMKRLETE